MSEIDSDGDLFPDCVDLCPNDRFKTKPEQCGCGVLEEDHDSDSVPDCIDGCPNDYFKLDPGLCGCGVVDDLTDTDGDGTADCIDQCPGAPDIDTDGDGVLDCIDLCPTMYDPEHDGDGAQNTDGDVHPDPASDREIMDCEDICPFNQFQQVNLSSCYLIKQDVAANACFYTPGTFKCPDGRFCLRYQNDDPMHYPSPCTTCTNPADFDGDGWPNCADRCPDDPLKNLPGRLGCRVPEPDADRDGAPDSQDACWTDPDKILPGCGVADTDTDGDGSPDCKDTCSADPAKIAPGTCGCGVADADSDGDGTADCVDLCPADPLKTEPGSEGCGVPEAAGVSSSAAVLPPLGALFGALVVWRGRRHAPATEAPPGPGRRPGR